MGIWSSSPNPQNERIDLLVRVLANAAISVTAAMIDPGESDHYEDGSQWICQALIAVRRDESR
jgi:hypothetical protein